MTPDSSRSPRSHPSMTSDGLGYRQTVSTGTQNAPQPSRTQPYSQRSSSHPSSSQNAVPSSSQADALLSQAMGRMALGPQSSTPPLNIVLFGEPGVGKSSVINLIARKSVARVPSGTNGSPLQFTSHDITIDSGTNMCIFETVGLDEPELRGGAYLAALEKAFEFVNTLSGTGGIHLLLFCICANRLTITTQSNYRLLSQVVFPIKVPIGFVVTGLEGEVEMEDWWNQNKTAMKRCGMTSDGHACITGITNRTPQQDRNYQESWKRIRELLKIRLRTPASLPEPHDWFVRLGRGMHQFAEKNPSRKPTQAEVMNVLVRRLRLEPRTVQGFLDIMEVQPSSGAGPSRVPTTRVSRRSSEGDVALQRPDATTRFQEWGTSTRNDGSHWQSGGVAEVSRGGQAPNPGRVDDYYPPRGTTAELGVTQSQSRYPGAPREGDRSGRWDSWGNRREMTAERVTTEPQGVSAPYIQSHPGVLMEDIRSHFPHDLTDSVTTDKRPFAHGSYGDIYKGKFNMGGRLIDVAVKAYRTYLQPDEKLPKRVEEFRDEISVWLKLQHPNVVQLYGTTRDPNMHPVLPAMVCQWVENGSLLGYLDRNSDLTVKCRLGLANDVAHGLRYLHSKQVVHGDLSGANVLVHADGSACIGDFGLATLLTKVVGSSFATSRRAKGAVRWMAPELLDPNGAHATPTLRSDVYSFGSIMLQILTGDIPYYDLPRDENVIWAILQGSKPDRTNSTMVTSGRWAFIERCWSRGTRPSSDEVVRFTEKELAGSPSSSGFRW